MKIKSDVLDLLAGMDGVIELGEILGNRCEGVIRVLNPLVSQDFGDLLSLLDHAADFGVFYASVIFTRKDGTELDLNFLLPLEQGSLSFDIFAKRLQVRSDTCQRSKPFGTELDSLRWLQQ